MIKKLKIKLFSILPKSIRKSFYKFSGRVDSVGREIYEGSIIRVIQNGFMQSGNYYGNLPNMKNLLLNKIDDNSVHCVQYMENVFDHGIHYKKIFGSDVFRDFEELAFYKTIIVLGHVEDYRKYAHLITGNFGSCIKFI